MSKYIFTTGTCLKSEMYDTIKNTMISAGWANVSSNPNTDFDVMTSTGEDGTRKLCIQMRPLHTNGSAGSSVITSDGNMASYRLVGGYTPGNAGSAGTFLRSSESWELLCITPSATSMPKETTLNYKFNANKNRVIFVIEYPLPFNVAPLVFYIGLPDIVYTSEPDSRGLLVISTSSFKASNYVHITEAVAEMPPNPASTTRPIQCTLSPKNPNSDGKIMLSKMYYGNATEGQRGMITGIFALPNSGISTGDIVTIGTRKFYVVVAQSYNTNGFPSLALAVEI